MLSYSVKCIGSSATIELITMNWAPYYGESLAENGVVTSITAAAFKDAGYEIGITFVPWKRALREVEASVKDGLLGAYKTNDRSVTMYFSNPIFFAEEAFFQLSSRSKITYRNLEDLAPYSIGTISGVSNSIAFDEADYLRKETSTNVDSLVKKLFTGRVDLIVQSKLVVLDIINKNYHPEYREKIQQVEPILVKRALYVTIRKSKDNSLEIINKFNNSLNNISKSGKLEKIVRRYGFL